MKKKTLVFIGLVLLTLALTSGTFAYTYTMQNTATMAGTLADDNFTTYTAAAIQPAWQSILPSSQTLSETLIPIANGDDTEFTAQVPDSGEQFDKVSDIFAGDMDAYISTMGTNQWQRDLFVMNPFTGMNMISKISDITVNFRIAAGGDYQVTAMGAIKVGGQVYEGPNLSTTGTTFITKQWATTINPATGEAWKWIDLQTLQAGLTAKGNGKNSPIYCTSITIVVDYSYTIVEGAVPTGDLFVITPHPDYTGDLMVKIYLTNTADVLKAYKYLNIKVFATGSLESSENPNFRLLSLENGVAIFNLQGGSASQYTVRVTGGGYRVMSEDSTEWTSGWSITPEFYCEVTQR
jgi:hypothetical protein